MDFSRFCFIRLLKNYFFHTEKTVIWRFIFFKKDKNCRKNKNNWLTVTWDIHFKCKYMI